MTGTRTGRAAAFVVVVFTSAMGSAVVAGTGTGRHEPATVVRGADRAAGARPRATVNDLPPRPQPGRASQPIASPIIDIDARRELAIRQVITELSACIVQIEVVGDVASAAGRPAAPTSGIVVDPAGYVISTIAGIGEPSAVFVRFANGPRVRAQIVARDFSRGLVLLRAEGVTDWPAIRLAEPGSARPGQTAIAMGRGLESTDVHVSVGIISATSRIWGQAVQTDAKVSPLNFGGALVSLKGQVYGVLAPRSPHSDQWGAGYELYDSGIGFATELTTDQLDQLKQGTDLHAGQSGISLAGSAPVLDPPVISAVDDESPAASAGLRTGDEIAAVNGLPIRRAAEYLHALGTLYAGESLTLAVRRDELTFDVEMKLVAAEPPR